MATGLEAPPVLSTPDANIIESAEPVVEPPNEELSDEELHVKYDIERTLREIREGRWQRIALQFPDEMLPDAPRVFQLLSRGLSSRERNMSSMPQDKSQHENEKTDTTRAGTNDCKVQDSVSLAGEFANGLKIESPTVPASPKLYILGDTSYGACCVDEVAAEHVDADVVVHYGRACLSPTARLPVIHVFTHRELDHTSVVTAFKDAYPDREERVVVVADVTFEDHVDAIVSTLEKVEGYSHVYATRVVRDPSSPIPNRTVPTPVQDDHEALKDWELFHISDPPTALLLTLSSRVRSIRIYPTTYSTPPSKPLTASTSAVLRRRYATVTFLHTVPVFGILINTLSVKNYLHIVNHVQKMIADAGKKSYMFVVGKLNAAKVANFSEIGGWVVIGCWESSLVDSKDFWKPIITPSELELALQSDAERVWTGAWSSDFQTLLNESEFSKQGDPESMEGSPDDGTLGNKQDADDNSSGMETAPPDFDLRTGRYITTAHSRPMNAQETDSTSQGADQKALSKRMNGDVATIAGVVSPGAEFLRSQRTWGGLGSDFAIEYEAEGVNEDGGRGGTVVEGRSGIARGYTVGPDPEKR